MGTDRGAHRRSNARRAVAALVLALICVAPAESAVARPLHLGPIASPPEIYRVQARVVEGERLLVQTRVAYSGIESRFPKARASFRARRDQLVAWHSFLASLEANVRLRLRNTEAGGRTRASTSVTLERDDRTNGKVIRHSLLLSRTQTDRLIGESTFGAARPDLVAGVRARHVLSIDDDSRPEYGTAGREGGLRVGRLPRSDAAPELLEQRSPCPAINMALKDDEQGARQWESTVRKVHYGAPFEIKICQWQEGAKTIQPYSQEDLGVPEHGRVSFDVKDQTGALVAHYRPDPGYVGPDEIVVYLDPGQASPDRGDIYTVRVDVRPFVMRAIGDSVTAGFGYWGTSKRVPTHDNFSARAGEAFPPGENGMDLGWLLDCRPPNVPDNRCSSNSGETWNGFSWSQDYGLGNNISWAAQLANTNNIPLTQNGLQTYANYAVTGSEPQHWEPVSENRLLKSTLGRVLFEDPDLTVLTLGANPILGRVLLSGDTLGCKWDSLFGKLKDCIDRLIREEKLYDRMKFVLTSLVVYGPNHVVISGYPSSFPALASNIFNVREVTYMEDEINAVIHLALNDVRDWSRKNGYGDRLRWSDPPPFYLGANTNGHDPYECNGHYVDGPSRQSLITQTDRLGECRSDTHWVLSNDSGIHPKWDGYTQMAASAQGAIRDMGLPLPLPLPASAQGRIASKLNYKCVDMPSLVDQTVLRMATCNGSDTQRFQLLPTGELKLRAHPDKCVDATTGGEGADVVIKTCDGSAAQRWQVVGDQIRGVNDRCLDIFGYNRADGAQLKVFHCHGDINQQWATNGV